MSICKWQLKGLTFTIFPVEQFHTESKTQLYCTNVLLKNPAVSMFFTVLRNRKYNATCDNIWTASSQPAQYFEFTMR